MKYRMKFSLILMGVLLLTPPAMALEGPLMKGKALALLCNSPKPDDQFSCQSYIAGIVDYHNLIKSLGASPGVDFCIPPGATMSEIKQIVIRYIALHTEHQDFIAAPGVAMGLYSAYPCKGR